MASGAGGSGAGGGDHRSSRSMGKTPVGPHEKSKKRGAWKKTMLHYLGAE
jgi:hypothetical protein